MAASVRKTSRVCCALLAGVLAVASCDPNVVIGAKWRTSDEPSGAGGSAPAGAGNAGSAVSAGTGGDQTLGGAAGDSTVGGDAGAAGAAAGQSPGGAGGAPDDGVVFSADHETGDLTQWDEGPDADSGGYYADTGMPSYSSAVAHSGQGSAELYIDTSGCQDQIARLYRRIETREGYYSAWFYLAEDHTPGTWWSIFLFRAVKDRNKSIDLWSLDLVRTKDNRLTVALYDHQNDKTIDVASQPIVPVQQWFQLEAYLYAAQGEPSRLTLWFGGTQILKLDATTPAPDGQPLYWVIGNGGSKMMPPQSTVYVDDAEVSTRFVGP